MLRPVNSNTFVKEVWGYCAEQLNLGAMQMDARSVGLRLVELAPANQDAKAVEEPYDDHFVVRYQMDVTMEGQRSQMSEVGVYTVAKGKIIKEVYLDLVSQ